MPPCTFAAASSPIATALSTAAAVFPEMTVLRLPTILLALSILSPWVFLPNISLRMIPWYPASVIRQPAWNPKTPVDIVHGSRCRTWMVHSLESAQPIGILRITSPSICRHASVPCSDGRRAWLRHDVYIRVTWEIDNIIWFLYDSYTNEASSGYVCGTGASLSAPAPRNGGRRFPDSGMNPARKTMDHGKRPDVP